MIAASKVEPVRPAVTMKYLWRLLSSGKTRIPPSAVTQARLHARHNLAPHSEVLSEENMGSETMCPISPPATGKKARLLNMRRCRPICAVRIKRFRGWRRMCKRLNSAKRTQFDPLGLRTGSAIDEGKAARAKIKIQQIKANSLF